MTCPKSLGCKQQSQDCHPEPASCTLFYMGRYGKGKHDDYTRSRDGCRLATGAAQQMPVTKTDSMTVIICHCGEAQGTVISNLVVLKVLPQTSSFSKCRFSGSTPDPLSQKCWGRSPEACLNKPFRGF